MEWKRRAFSDVLAAAFEYDEGRRGASCVEVTENELLIQFQSICQFCLGVAGPM